jgi:hypothetical protein
MASPGQRRFWWLMPWSEVRLLRSALSFADASVQRLAARNSGLYAELERERQKLAAIMAAPGSPGAPSDGETEFVLVGIARKGGQGKRLWASKDLAGTSFGMGGEFDGFPAWVIHAVMGHALTVDRPTYGEALAWLMARWQDEMAGKPAIGPARKQLPG